VSSEHIDGSLYRKTSAYNMDDCEQEIHITTYNASPLNGAPQDDTSDSLTVFEVFLELKVAHCSTKSSFMTFHCLVLGGCPHLRGVIKHCSVRLSEVIQPACITDSFL
jgi:hypothetical protein